MQDKNELEHIYDVTLFNIDDLDVLLHESLKHARELLSVQAGTIYLKEEENLKFHVFQNDLMSYEDIYINYCAIKNLKLPLNEKNKYLCVDAFLTRKIIIIDDIYHSSIYDFVGTKEFDTKFNFKTISILSVPLIHPITNDCLGVIQLLNKTIDNKVLPFDLKDKEIISMLSSFMALSISKAQEDVIRLKEVNDELLKINEDLEKRVQEEVSQNQQKSAIIFHQSKMASMGEMLTNIAHQWRQPLSTISTLASGLSLEFQLDKVSKENAVAQLRKIVLTTQNLSKTIDEFKGFYNIESIQEQFTLKSVIDKSLELAEVVLSYNKINVVCNIDETITLYGLKNEFTQAFLNILTAVKDNLLKDIISDKPRYIFINIFQENNKKYIKVIDNSIHTLHFDDKNRKYSKFNMGIYMTKLIFQKHFNGELNHRSIEYKYENQTLKGGEYTITLS